MNERVDGAGAPLSAPRSEGNGQQTRIGRALIHTQRLAGIGETALGVVHELTNPVSVITGTVNSMRLQLQEGPLEMEALIRYLDLIESSAWRCAGLLQSLREYGFPDPAERQQANLNAILEEALAMFAYPLSRESNVEVKSAFGVDLPPLSCDPTQLAQVAVNLLLNARDAMQPAGGSVTLASWADLSRKTVAFSVRDEGTGIAPEHLERVFEPFFTTKEPGQGIGLGLAISRLIVAEHGGSLTAANHPDGGATFTVTLPCRPAE